MKSAISAFIMKYLSRAGVAVSGPLGWILSLFVDRFAIWVEKKITVLAKWIKDSIAEKKQTKEDEKNEQNYIDVINKPDKTEQQIDDATSDFLNSGMQDERKSP